jgi:hypothetical protein
MSNQDSIHLTDKYLSDTITKNEEEDKQKDESIKVIDNITQETKIKFKEIERVLIKLSKDDDLENLKPLDKAQIKESQEKEENPLEDIFGKDDKPPIPPIYGRIKKKYQKIIDLKRDWFICNALINFPYGKHRPHVELFLSVIDENIYKCDENLIIGLYKELKSVSFKKKYIQQGKYDSGKRKGNEKYINGLFNYRSSLLVIQMDLSYKYDYLKVEFGKGVKDSYTFSEYNKYLRNKSKVVKDDIKCLIKILKNGYEDDLVGYMLKLKYSPQKQFYLKLILFFDGRVYDNEDENKIAKKVGDLWREEITKGEGNYFNHNAYRESRFIHGIGLKHKDEQNVVIKAAMELIKPDYFVRSMLFDKKQKTFQRGQVPNTRKVTKPRKNNEIYYKYILPKKTFKK